MIGIELSKIIIDEKSQEQVVVLREKEGSRVLPIIIGINEALAIRIKLGNVDPPRPLTHDLIKKILESLGITVERVVIDKLINETFHAKLFLRKGDGSTVIVDARPSDGIALAVRTGAPLFVEDEILAQSSVK